MIWIICPRQFCCRVRTAVAAVDSFHKNIRQFVAPGRFAEEIRYVLGFTVFRAAMALNLMAIGPGLVRGQGSDNPLGPVWQCYTIDNSLCGADGVKLADANGDGLPDLVVGWEESGRVRAYFHPGSERVTRTWPMVDLGAAPSVEDAVWCDLNADGQLDVLSSCEGQEQSLRMHLAPREPGKLLDAKAWETTVVPRSRGKTRWMFAVPFGKPPGIRSETVAWTDGRPDIVVGSKNPGGLIGILRTRGSPAEWHIEKLADASWIMSIELCDMDGDDDQDILYSDRKGSESGIYWLENPGSVKGSNEQSAVGEQKSPGVFWPQHRIGAMGEEVMFIARLKNGPGDNLSNQTVVSRILTSVKPCTIYQFDRVEPNEGNDAIAWESSRIEFESVGQTGRAKGIAAADIDLDGHTEVVLSFEGASEGKSGVVYLDQSQVGGWRTKEVSGSRGIKFDLIELLDIDSDGDLDILTCEERHNDCGLGVIWYQNPIR